MTVNVFTRRALLIFVLFSVLPSSVLADTVQSDASTSTPYVSAGYTNFQTLGTGLSGTLTAVDISYFADMTYYGVRVSARIEECSSDAYGDCATVSEPVIAPDFMPSNGVQSIDFTDYAFNHCKYYRLVLVGTGPSSMGALRYHGSDGDSYAYGAYDGDGAYGDDIVDDIYFVLRGVDRLDRSANTPENLCVDPVIIVPGLLGSFEKNGVLLMDPILHAYDDIVATFLANGYVASSTLFTFPYNWRDSNIDTAILLKQKIDEIKSICNCSKVDIVAHSMGGLVTRQYVQSDGYEYDVDQVVFLATPHLGSPKAYLAWEGGAFPMFSRDDLVILQIISQEGKHDGFSDAFDYIQNRPINSLKELLPIYDYKKLVDVDSLNVTDEVYPNNYPVNVFIKNLDTHKSRLSRVEYINMISSSSPTIGSISVGPFSTSTGDMWEHGEPLNLVRGSALGLVDGDGTVPVVSASTLGNNIYVESSHTGIVRDVNANVFETLSGRIPTTVSMDLAHVDVPFLIFLMFSPADMTIVSPDGKRVGYSSAGEVNEIPGAFYTGSDTENEFIVIPNPLDGEYKVETVGIGDGEYTVAVSSISGDVVTETEYTGVARVGDIAKLVLNVDISSPSPNLAIAPESLPTLAEVPSANTPVVARSGGGGGRRSTAPVATIPATSTVQNTVNPDTFMITLDVPMDRFVVLMMNPSSRSTNPPVRSVAERIQSTKEVTQTQVASVISAVGTDSSESGFVGKIKEGFKKLFYKFKKQ